MKPETYWPQNKLYFYATCALFPGKLLDTPLSSQQFKDYIPYYWSVDEQIKELEQLKQVGLLDITISRIDDSNAEYSIAKIDSNGFISILKEYLERYRNDELIGETGYTFVANNDQLMVYLNSSTRDEPAVNPANIWDNWTSFDNHRFPFWEVVLTFQLIDVRGEITALGYSGKSNSSYEEARPFVNVKVFKKELQQNTHKPQKPINHKVGIIVTPKGKLQLSIDGKRAALRTYKSEKNDTYRAARSLYEANGEYLDRSSLNLNAGRKTLIKDLIKNMGMTGIIAELFIEYGDNNTVRLKRHAAADEDQFKQLLFHVNTVGQKNE